MGMSDGILWWDSLLGSSGRILWWDSMTNFYGVVSMVDFEGHSKDSFTVGH